MFEKNKSIREKAYKCRDANNVKVPVTWEAQRTTKLGGSQIEIQSCLTSHPRELDSNLLPPRRRWLLPCHSPHSFQSIPGRTPAMLSHCPGSSPLESQRGHSQHERGTVNNNTRFSHIFLRLCRNCEQKKAGESYISLLRLENWFQVYQKQQVLQSKWKVNLKRTSWSAWNVSHGQK